MPADWIKINSTKQVYRYRSPTLQKRLEILEQWQERVQAGKSLRHVRRASHPFADPVDIFLQLPMPLFRLFSSKRS